MGFEFVIFLSSGLFMGWSLGANDAANIFGTAVGTHMVRFRTAAIICCVFIVIGAVASGSGASKGLGALGSVNTLAGAFVVSFCAAFTVMWMTRLGLPVSTTQAIVGAIIGWNVYSGNPTDPAVLSKIVSTWVYGPILAAIFAIGIFLLVRRLVNSSTIHMIMLDRYTRTGLILAGIFGAYSLGANNIANVMGVFVSATDFNAVELVGLRISGIQQLFLLGGVAISVGVVTYSKRVMMTVGNNLFKLSPVSAFVVIVSTALVLFLFSSQELSHWALSRGLPALPLIPVSQSQACVGAVIGISIAKGAWRSINFRLLGKISLGWVATPIMASVLSYMFLFFMQNVFMQQVYQ
ncbi:MAG: inorganic phosphate transporter [Sphaerochaeta sp.]|nr:inorganic phosphate transporter [Sphaerochaeta sp.]